MTSFLSFQQEIEARSKKEQLPILNTLTVSKFDVKETDSSDSRPLLDRLIDPIESSSLVAHIQTRLNRKAEVLLRLSYPGNLSSKHWESLFDPEDTALTNEAWDLSQDQTDRILATLHSAANEIGAQAGLVFSPLIHKRQPVPTSSQDEDAQRNDPEIDEKWTPKGLRVFLRSVPQDASDAQELRVAVTGNVDSGKSTLLGVLVRGALDDGRGRARVALFR